MRKYVFNIHHWQAESGWTDLINEETRTEKEWLLLKDMTEEEFIKYMTEEAEYYEGALIDYAEVYGHYDSDFDKKTADMNLRS